MRSPDPKCQVVQQSSQLHTSSPNWTVCWAPNWQHFQTCFSQFQASANDYQLYTATLHKPIVFLFLWNHRTQTSPDSPYSMLTFLLLMECQNPDLARQPLSSQFLVSLESQDPDLARQPLFHSYFLLLMECQDPGLARQPLSNQFHVSIFSTKTVLWAYARLQASSFVNLVTSCNLVHVLTFHNVSFRLFRNLCKS